LKKQLSEINKRKWKNPVYREKELPRIKNLVEARWKKYREAKQKNQSQVIKNGTEI